MSGLRDLGHGVYGLALPKANVYFIESGDGLSLVDTATHGSLPLIERALIASGRRLESIRRIIATHAHVDHVGGLAEVQAASSAPVWAHRLDAPLIRRGEHPPYPEAAALRPVDRWLGRLIDQSVGRSQPPAPVARELQGGEPLGEALPGWEVVHLPGHTPGHIGLWWPQRAVLLGGDVAMHLTPWLSAPLAAFTTDAAQARASIRWAARLRPDVLALGHGPALVGNAAAALDTLVARLARPAWRSVL